MIFAQDERAGKEIIMKEFKTMETENMEKEMMELPENLDELIDLALTTGNSSVRRLSLTVAYRLELKEEDLRTDLLDFCLEHMTDFNELPGIQSICMKFAYRISAFYPELMGELLRILEGMDIEYYKPAVKSVRSRILKAESKKR